MVAAFHGQCHDDRCAAIFIVDALSLSLSLSLSRVCFCFSISRLGCAAFSVTSRAAAIGFHFRSIRDARRRRGFRGVALGCARSSTDLPRFDLLYRVLARLRQTMLCATSRPSYRVSTEFLRPFRLCSSSGHGFYLVLLGFAGPLRRACPNYRVFFQPSFPV